MLEDLTLNDNLLSGSVPNGLWSLPVMEELDVSGNVLLTGVVPAELCADGGTVAAVVDCENVQNDCCTRAEAEGDGEA